MKLERKKLTDKKLDDLIEFAETNWKDNLKRYENMKDGEEKKHLGSRLETGKDIICCLKELKERRNT